MKDKIFCCLSIFFTLFLTHLDADVGKYLKPAFNKENIHQLRNIDFIYMINLDQRPEKWQSSCKQLNPWGVCPYRFSAVNGWELRLEAINDVGVTYQNGMKGGFMGTYYPSNQNFQPQHELIKKAGRTYFCHCMTPGAIGIVLSHLSVLQDALNSGYETIWVMEDDIEVIRDPHLISDYIELLDAQVGKNWDILFTDLNTKDQQGRYVVCASYAQRPNFNPKNPHRFCVKRKVGVHFYQIGARYGAYSMILRRSGIKKILSFIKKHHIFLPYDMDYYLPEGIRMYTVSEDIVSTMIKTLSDNRAPGYRNSEK